MSIYFDKNNKKDIKLIKRLLHLVCFHCDHVAQITTIHKVCFLFIKRHRCCQQTICTERKYIIYKKNSTKYQPTGK